MRLSRRIEDGVGVEVVRRSLPEGCCPLLFPVTTSKPRESARYPDANHVVLFCLGCTFHPGVPWEQFLFEARMKLDILVLPIHQNLGLEK